MNANRIKQPEPGWVTFDAEQTRVAGDAARMLRGAARQLSAITKEFKERTPGFRWSADYLRGEFAEILANTHAALARIDGLKDVIS